MTFPLTREDVSLIVEALELIGNDAASSLKKRLLSHYSLIQEEVQEWQSFVTDQASFFFSICKPGAAKLIPFAAHP
jgi:hypothetical protein